MSHMRSEKKTSFFTTRLVSAPPAPLPSLPRILPSFLRHLPAAMPDARWGEGGPGRMDFSSLPAVWTWTSRGTAVLTFSLSVDVAAGRKRAKDDEGPVAAGATPKTA